MQSNSPIQTVNSSQSYSDYHPIKRETASLPKPAEPLHHYLSSSEQKEKSSILLDKKVEILKQFQQVSQLTADHLPSRFIQTMVLNKEYISQIKAMAQNFLAKTAENPNNFTWRCEAIYHLLLSGEIFLKLAKTEGLPAHKIEEFTSAPKTYLERAKNELRQAQKLDTLNARYYDCKSMIMEFERIDCKNIEQVEEYLQLLKLALVLNPESADYKQRLDKAISFLKSRWLELKQEGTIPEAKYQEWSVKLEGWQNRDALKELFYRNPDLFKLSSMAKHAEFFKQHPELTNARAFLTEYPELGSSIHIANLSSIQCVRDTLAKEENNPFATKLILVPKDEDLTVLTPVIANEIKKAMINYAAKNKLLKIYVRSNDFNTLRKCFEDDKTLLQKEGEVLQAAKVTKGALIVYAAFVLPESSFLKKKPN